MHQGHLLLKVAVISRLLHNFCFYEEDARKFQAGFVRLYSLLSKECWDLRLVLGQLKKGYRPIWILSVWE
jgi:hypothetical protein